MALFVVNEQALTEYGCEQERDVRGHKNPVMQQITVKNESDRCRQLTNEEPVRYPGRSLRFPLGIHLAPDRRQQDD